MISRFVGLVLAVLWVSASGVYAQADAVTREKLEKGETAGLHVRAQMTARRISAESQQESVQRLIRARAEYRLALIEMKKEFKSQGNAEMLQRVTQELDDFERGRKFTYQYWEDRLPEVRMGPYNEAADALLIKANSLRRTINPIGKKDRLLSAIRIYRKILEEYPNSAAVEPAAFGLGECFSHSLIGDYRRSVKFYEMCYIANGKSDHDPLYRAAKVLDSQLSDYDTACKYYEMAAKTSSSGWSRRMAASRLETLRKAGFGGGLPEKEKEATAPEK